MPKRFKENLHFCSTNIKIVHNKDYVILVKKGFSMIHETLPLLAVISCTLCDITLSLGPPTIKEKLVEAGCLFFAHHLHSYKLILKHEILPQSLRCHIKDFKIVVFAM